MSARSEHKKQRQRLRRRLQRQGRSPEAIEAAVQVLQQRQLEQRRQAATDTEAAALAAQMAAAGAGPLRIDQAVTRLRAQHAAAHRAGIPPSTFEATIRNRLQAERPDDTRHRPALPDPLLRGPARTTRRTARAASRTRATTRWELARDTPGRPLTEPRC